MPADAYFDLNGQHVSVRLFDSTYGPGLGFECPRCGTWGIVLDEKRSFEVSSTGELTIDGPVVCRKRGCSMALEVEDGVGTVLFPEPSGAEGAVET